MSVSGSFTHLFVSVVEGDCVVGYEGASGVVSVGCLLLAKMTKHLNVDSVGVMGVEKEEFFDFVSV